MWLFGDLSRSCLSVLFSTLWRIEADPSVVLLEILFISDAINISFPDKSWKYLRNIFVLLNYSYRTLDWSLNDDLNLNDSCGKELRYLKCPRSNVKLMMLKYSNRKGLTSNLPVMINWICNEPPTWPSKIFNVSYTIYYIPFAIHAIVWIYGHRYRILWNRD